MKNNVTRKVVLFFVTVVTLISSVCFVGCGGGTGDNGNGVVVGGNGSSVVDSSEVAEINEFYTLVVDSQTCLDALADDIYSYWYDAIYEDAYGGNINYAIAYAMMDNSENLDKIEENEILIQSLYKKIKDSDLSSEIKAVMLAYSDYYEFVVNVSGSFNSYSASKETLKKELASALKRLYLEM